MLVSAALEQLQAWPFEVLVKKVAKRRSTQARVKVGVLVKEVAYQALVRPSEYQDLQSPQSAARVAGSLSLAPTPTLQVAVAVSAPTLPLQRLRRP